MCTWVAEGREGGREEGERGREEGERGREEGMGGKALADKQGMGIARQCNLKLKLDIFPYPWD